MSTSARTGSQVGPRLGYLFKHAGMLMSELNDTVLAPFGIEQRPEPGSRAGVGVGEEPATDLSLVLRNAPENLKTYTWPKPYDSANM